MSKTYSAGIVTAYGAAKRAGYQGTYEDFCRQQAQYAENAQTVEQAKNTAVSAANTATTKAGEATTAATAAQTAKTQTEAAASQALTDISTARSGAISAVQTEGQTQTANARAQAQAAATSATTASTKASEASASATSAGQSATNAAASATSAAQSASNAQDVLESIPADYTDLSADVEQLKADLGENYVGLRAYLTAEDDVFALPMGSYGISSVANKKPINLPSDFVATHNGYVIILEAENSVTRVGFVVDAYARKIWVRTGYEWLELSKVTTTDASIASAINSVYSYLYANMIPDFTELASNFYAINDEVTTTKIQYKFIDSTGVKDIATTYSDWYVTDEISVMPFTFYYLTGSARSAGHYIYAIYDADGNVLAYESATSWTIVSRENMLIYTPYGASKIRIASVNGVDGASLYTVQDAYDKKWSGIKWACMGDSLTANNIRTTMHYHDYIADKTGINVVNLGAGGTGYKQSYAGVSGFMDRVDTIPLDSDVVTIFGSGNDHSYQIGTPSDTGTDTLCGCINTTISRIFDRITTCNLGIITPTPWQGYNPADNTNWMAQYSEAIVQICKNWGVPCLDLYHCSNLRPWDADFRTVAYSKDDGGGTHPDETGHKLIAPRFEAFLDELLMH